MAQADVSQFPPRQRWDAAVLLGLGVFLIVARVPLGAQILGVLSLIVVVVQGMVWRPFFGLLMTFFLIAGFSSALATIANPSALVAGYFLMILCYGLFGAAVCFSGDLRRNIKMVFAGVYVGLWMHLLISLGEFVSGIKILALRDPLSSSAAVARTYPSVVSSLFVNYNDYSVTMVVLVNMAMSKLLFVGNQTRWQTLARLFAVCSASALTVVIGSRGALVALLATSALQLLVVTRLARPGLVSKGVLWLVMGVGGVALLGLWNTPYFQTHSTQWRGQIVTHIMSLFSSNPTMLLTGFGSSKIYAEIADKAFPGLLLDPHNMLIEIVLGFGILSLVIYLLCMIVVFVRGLMNQQFPHDSLGLTALTTGLGLLVYGSVPSSYLDYGYPFIFLITAMAAINLVRLTPRAASADDPGHDGNNRPHEECDTADQYQPNYG